jgi:hypothetical protein
MWRPLRGTLLAMAAGAHLGLVGCSGGGGDGWPPRSTSTATSTRTPTSTPSRPVTTTPTVTPTAPPGVAVTGAFPAIGPAAGGAPVLIEGSGFNRGGANSVLFGGVAATSVITLSDRRISVVAPAGPVGSSVSVTVTNDGGTDTFDGAYRYAGGGATNVLNLELANEPTMRFDNQIGTTTVVVDYLVRDSQGVPVDESDLNVAMFVDDVRLGTGGVLGESVLDRDSEELEFNVFVLMVLDASFSLQQFTPPQFGPMLTAAQSLVDAGTEIWSSRRGEFDWNLVWFDELISRPDPAHGDTFRIANIPVPQPGNFTKLYSAVSNSLELAAAARGAGIAAGPRDRHVIVVFTDGQDNLSSFDNRDVKLTGTLINGDPYPRCGWKTTDLEDIFSEIAAAPGYPANLTVHTIALGVSCETAPPGSACFDETALSRIAQVGFGQQLASTGNVAALFDQIRKEFTTLQSSGAKMALRPNDYEFRLAVTRPGNNAAGEVRFRFRVRTNSAEFLGFS